MKNIKEEIIMYKKLWWIFPLIGLGLEFGLFWIIGVAFMEYGICWRTVLATFVMVLLRVFIKIVYQIPQVKSGIQKVDQYITTH